MVSPATLLLSVHLSHEFYRYCRTCLDADATLSITFKAPTRKSVRKRTQRDYADMNSGLDSNSNRWIRVLEKKEIKDSPFKRLDGSSVGIQWLQEDESAMTEPIIIERPDGLGMKMPSNDFTVDEVAELVGPDMPVEVIGTVFYSCILWYPYVPKTSLHSPRRMGGH